MAHPTVVRTKSDAEKLVQALSELDTQSCHVAWRAEVAGWSPATGQSPLEVGSVTAAAVFCDGLRLDLGASGAGSTSSTQSPSWQQAVWIDNLAPDAPLSLLKDHFRDPRVKKVFHSSPFHVHSLTRALGGPGSVALSHPSSISDTLRMGWLLGAKYLSLSALSKEYLDAEYHVDDLLKLFGVPGTDGKLKLPDVEQLQSGSATAGNWMEQSLKSVTATWHLHSALSKELSHVGWNPDAAVLDLSRGTTIAASAAGGTDAPKKRAGAGGGISGRSTLLDCYSTLIAPVTTAVISMEQAGMAIDPAAVQRVKTAVEAGMGTPSSTPAAGTVAQPAPAPAPASSPPASSPPTSPAAPAAPPAPAPFFDSFGSDDIASTGFAAPSQPQAQLLQVSDTSLKRSSAAPPPPPPQASIFDFDDDGWGSGFSLMEYATEAMAAVAPPPPVPTAKKSGGGGGQARKKQQGPVTAAAKALTALHDSFLQPLSALASSPGVSPSHVVVAHPSINPNTINGHIVMAKPACGHLHGHAVDKYRARAVVVPREPSNTLLSLRIHHLHLSLLAHMAKSKGLIAALNEAAAAAVSVSGSDGAASTMSTVLYTAVARDVFGTKTPTKAQVHQAQTLLQAAPHGILALHTAPAAAASKPSSLARAGAPRPASNTSVSSSASRYHSYLAYRWSCSEAEVAKTIAAFNACYPEVGKWQARQRDDCMRGGGWVFSIGGRSRAIDVSALTGNPSSHSSEAAEAKRIKAERTLVTAALYGSAADAVNAVLSRLHRQSSSSSSSDASAGGTGSSPADLRGFTPIAITWDEVLLEGQAAGVDAAKASILSTARAPFAPGQLSAPLLVSAGTGSDWQAAYDAAAVQ